MKLLFPGGINENDGTRPEECQEGYNFELVFGDTDFRPRRPQDIKGVTPLNGSISGLMQLIKKDNTETTLVFEDDASAPTLYSWDGTNYENILTYSEQIDHANWAKSGTPVITANTTVATDGTTTADTIEDNDGAAHEYILQVGASFIVTESYTASTEILADSTPRVTRFPAIYLQFSGSTTETSVLSLDTYTGEYDISGAGATGSVVKTGDYWKVSLKNASADPLNTSVIQYLLPAYGGSASWAPNVATTGSVINWGSQLRRSNTSSAYIKTEASIHSAFTSVRTINLATGSKLRSAHYVLDDVLTIVDIEKLTPLMKWDGTTLTRHKTGIFEGNPASVASINRSSQTATVATAAPHSLSTGDLVKHAGAIETEYNIEAEITVTGASTYTFTVAGSPATPATGTITFDVGTEIFAKYAIVHNGRMWLFNVKSGSADTPHLMVISQFENIEIFDTATRVGDSGFSTGEEAFYMLTKDLKPVNGVTVFHQQLIISTVDGRMFRLSGDDSTNYAWVDYYGGSAAIGNESIINFGNDVAFMRKGGHIDSLIATDTSGDVDVDNISRWITDTIKDLDGALTVYDQTYQKVYFFVLNKVLVLYKDVLYGYGRELSPWSIYTTNLTNKFNAVSAVYLRRPSESTYSVYWGDDSGHIYDMNGDGQGDSANTDIETYRRTNIIEEPEVINGIIFGKVQYRRKGDLDLIVSLLWTGAYNTTESTIALEGPPSSDIGAYFGAGVYFGGDVYFGQGFEFSDLVSKKNFSPAGRDNSFFLSLTAETSIRFKVDNLVIGTV